MGQKKRDCCMSESATKVMNVDCMMQVSNLISAYFCFKLGSELQGGYMHWIHSLMRGIMTGCSCPLPKLLEESAS